MSIAWLKRRWYLIPLALLALVVAVVVLVFIFLGHIARAGVSTALPKITGTPVNMTYFWLNPLTGNLHIHDFTIGNPKGYQTPHVFNFRDLKVEIEVGSILSDRIVIREILVDGLQVSYETKLTESNVGRIKRNVDQFATRDQAQTQPGPGDDGAKAKKPGKKIQINRLRLTNGSVVFAAGLAGQGAATTLPLPEIVLTDLGKEREKANTGEVAEEIFTALHAAIIKAVANAGIPGADDLKNAAGKTGEKIEEGAQGLVQGVKDLF